MIRSTENQIFKAGFIAVVGRPNVGKSSLINRLVGQKIAAVSAKPQTTRKSQLGILTGEGYQIILTDTPGLHLPRNLLGSLMNEEASRSLDESDGLIWLVDASVEPTEEDRLVAEQLQPYSQRKPAILTLNKIDLVERSGLLARTQNYTELLTTQAKIQISTTTGENLPELVNLLLEVLPESLPFFPDSQLTDAYEREIAADLIREAALLHLYDEVPYSIAVRIDEYTERGDRGAYIAASLFVERKSQKPIVIGQGGETLKKIGTSARAEIESMSGRKVYLELRVKTRKNWRNDKNALLSFGF